MKAEVIGIGRYVKVPFDVVRSKLSNRTFRIWMFIAADVSPKNPIAKVRQSTLADQVGCSTDTISRAIAELMKHGLLCEVGRWNQGRCKVYRLSWNPKIKIEEEAPIITHEEPKCATATNELDDLLAAHGAKWSQAYQCFDGESGRPTLRACVEEAITNSSRSNSANLKTFVDGWLHITSQRWKVKHATPPAPRTENPPASAVQGVSESHEERAWIIAQIELDNENQRRKEAMEARARASYGGRGNPFANKPFEPKVEPPICRENYPLSWAFLRIKWAESNKSAAA